jgi:endonuclease/exonuclease/phosphatase (EEP) superfamily protein YafD
LALCVFKNGVFAFQVGVILLCLPAFFLVNRRLDNLTLFYQYLLFAPLILSFGLALFVRFFRPISIFCMLIVVLILVLPFARDYLKNDPQGTQAGPVRLKVATYNAQAGSNDLLAFNTWLRVEQPDIVAIQEITPAQVLNTQNLNDLYPHSTAALNPNDVLIISRLPIIAQKRIIALMANVRSSLRACKPSKARLMSMRCTQKPCIAAMNGCGATTT